MIKTVQMRNCATYSAEGASINDCRKINFFYGPNGSGKSTISNYLSSYSKSSGTPKYSSCDIQWENDSPVEIVVYNKNFRTRHLKEDIAGIFTLGEEADIGQLNTIEKLKDDRNNKGEILSGLEKSLKEVLSEKTHQEAEFKDGIWQKIFKQNEGIFSELFHGLRNSKDRFKEVVVNRFENRLHTNNSSNTKDGLLKKYNQLFSQQLEKYDDIAIPEDKLFSDLKKIEEDPIWSKSIVGNKKVPISQLIDSLNNADWVNEGRLYVRENGVCPFCQQETITKKLKRQLDDFFNGEYESDIQNIETLISEYKEISERLLRFLEDVIDNDVASNIGDISPLVFKTDTDSLKALFKSNLDRMLMKKREASKKVLLDKSYSKLNSLKKTISSINQKIAENNNLVDNVGEEKKALLDAVWVLLVNEQEPLISVYLDKLANIKKSENGINNKIDKIKKELKELDNSILTAEKNITSV